MKRFNSSRSRNSRMMCQPVMMVDLASQPSETVAGDFATHSNPIIPAQFMYPAQSQVVADLSFAFCQSVCSTLTCNGLDSVVDAVVFKSSKKPVTSEALSLSLLIDVLTCQASHGSLSFGKTRLDNACATALTNRNEIVEIAKKMHASCCTEDKEEYDISCVKASSLPTKIMSKNQGYLILQTSSSTCILSIRTYQLPSMTTSCDS
eukprot:7098619-Ditylum_brightwellii.AAC.1